ncbi:MAG: hypothetical protein ACRDZ3_12995, partial [Acidimicrobiia bacterium]
TGVCGWFSEQFADRFESVNICGYDGVTVVDGRPTQVAEPLVVIDRYACFFEDRREPRGPSARCESEHHEFVGDRAGLAIDPMLRRATIVTTAQECAVEVEFAGTSAAMPTGGIGEYHEVGPGGSVGAWGDQTVSRPAHWWGKVCGRLVVANNGQGQMWRNLSAGANRFTGGDREGGEVA